MIVLGGGFCSLQIVSWGFVPGGGDGFGWNWYLHKIKICPVLICLLQIQLISDCFREIICEVAQILDLSNICSIKKAEIVLSELIFDIKDDHALCYWAFWNIPYIECIIQWFSVSKLNFTFFTAFEYII